MKIIVLRNGAECFVSDEDYEYLNKWKWKINRTGYACRNLTKPNRRYTVILMHRLIAKRAGMLIDDYEVDHIDRIRLNNQRDNLRPASRQQNAWNCERKTGVSGVAGVTFCKRRGTYMARIRVGNGKRIHIGNFASALEAKQAYDVAKLERDRHAGLVA